MRLGLALPHYDTSLAGSPVSFDKVAAAASVAEANNFSSAWVSDHLFLDWSKYGGPPDRQGCLECWTTLSALAAQTSSLRLGSLALCNDLRNPGLLAKMVATTDLLSGGRIDVGLGAGWYEPEYAAAGIEFSRASRRIERLGESVQIVARLLEGEELSFDGRHYEMDGAICRPGPTQQPRPPIWIGGKGDRLLGVVAARADGWNFSWLSDVATYAERVAALDRACDAADRDPASVRRSVGAYVLAGADDADVARRFERLVERTPAGVLSSANGGRGVSWDEFRSRSIAGTTQRVIDELGRLAEMGVEEVIVGLGAIPFQVADLEDVELVGTEIAPALADIGGA